MKKDTGDKVSKFWKFVYDIHLYDTKGEALFKAFIIAFSWIGAVYMDSLPDEISVLIAANLFLFSASLVMEYAMKLVTTENIVPRILPSVIVITSGLCAVAAFSELLGKSFCIQWECIYKITAVLTMIIVFDVAIQAVSNYVPKQKIEENLKGVKVN